MEPTTFSFYKEQTSYYDTDTKWYIDFPGWEGERDDLEMVYGADDMLEYLDDGSGFVDLMFSDEPFDGHNFELHYDYPYCEGAMYTLESNEMERFSMWLCYVTEYVFGYLPNVIYCYHINFE